MSLAMIGTAWGRYDLRILFVKFLSSDSSSGSTLSPEGICVNVSSSSLAGIPNSTFELLVPSMPKSTGTCSEVLVFESSLEPAGSISGFSLSDKETVEAVFRLGREICSFSCVTVLSAAESPKHAHAHLVTEVATKKPSHPSNKCRKIKIWLAAADYFTPRMITKCEILTS